MDDAARSDVPIRLAVTHRPCSNAETGAARLGDRGWTLGVLVLFYVLNAFDRTILSLMIVPARRDLHLTDTQLGLLLGFGFAAFFAVSSIPFGILVDRFSRRNLLWIGISLWSAATVACAFARDFEQLLAARMVLGAGEAALTPAAMSLLAQKFAGGTLGRAMSIFVSGGLVGNATAVILGGWAVTYFDAFGAIVLPLVGPVRGWQFPFLLIGVTGLVAGCLTRTVAEPPRGRAERNRATSFWPILRRRQAVLASFLCSYILLGMLLYSCNLWVPALVIRRFGWTPARAGAMLGPVSLVCTVGGTALAGAIVDRLQRRGHDDASFRVLFWSLAVAAPASLVAFLAPTVPLFLAGYVVFCLFGLSFAGYCYASVQQIAAGDTRGRFTSFFFLAQILIGAGAGPSLVGFLSGVVFAGDVGRAMLSLCAVVLPVAMIAAWVGRKPLVDAIVENRLVGDVGH